MTSINDIEKCIEKKREEIHHHELQIRDRNAQIKVLNDMLPKELNEKPNPNQVVRPGSTIPKARVKKGGRPLNISGSSAEPELPEETAKVPEAKRSRANAKEKDDQGSLAIKHEENHPSGPIENKKDENKEDENREEADDMPF
jgi:hypothetical protein